MYKFEDALKEAGEIIFEKIGTKASQNILKGGQGVHPSMVTERSGRLTDAVLGGAGGIREYLFSGDTAKLSIGVKGSVVPYANLQEKGGTRPVTDKMRRFFWAKYFNAREVGDPKISMWSALRFKNMITYPKRSYLEPAVYEVAQQIPEILKRYSMNYIRLSILEAVNGK